ncbi:MAG: damage-inducible protein DinB [Sphingobacteriales bacterium]|nr:MAG: damage-inducible protein DinB [Sphingobacteriales bacterium]
MSILKLMTNVANYNNWVTQQYLNWLAAKTDEALNAQVPSSFPSILLTLDHIWQTQEYWVDIITESKSFVFNPDRSGSTKETIFEGYAASSKRLADYVARLSEAEVEKTVRIEQEYFSCNYEKYEYIHHIINHGLYHRGQIVTMGRVVGITDAPMTDYNFYKVMNEAQR